MLRAKVLSNLLSTMEASLSSTWLLNMSTASPSNRAALVAGRFRPSVSLGSRAAVCRLVADLRTGQSRVLHVGVPLESVLLLEVSLHGLFFQQMLLVRRQSRVFLVFFRILEWTVFLVSVIESPKQSVVRVRVVFKVYCVRVLLGFQEWVGIQISRQSRQENTGFPFCSALPSSSEVGPLLVQRALTVNVACV
jgi:hypothetical protein